MTLSGYQAHINRENSRVHNPLPFHLCISLSSPKKRYIRLWGVYAAIPEAKGKVDVRPSPHRIFEAKNKKKIFFVTTDKKKKCNNKGQKNIFFATGTTKKIIFVTGDKEIFFATKNKKIYFLQQGTKKKNIFRNKGQIFFF